MNISAFILFFTLFALAFSAEKGSSIAPQVDHAITDAITSAYYTYGSDPLNNAMGTSQELNRIFEGFWIVINNINNGSDKAFVTPSINNTWYRIYDVNYFKFATSYKYYLSRIQRKNNKPIRIANIIARGQGVDAEMSKLISSAISSTNSDESPVTRAIKLHNKLQQMIPLTGMYWSVYTQNNRKFYAYIGCFNSIWQTDDRMYNGNAHHTLVWAVQI